ncbi:MAG: protein O-mannosyl-transferase family [Bradymonadia bacterium]
MLSHGHRSPFGLESIGVFTLTYVILILGLPPGLTWFDAGELTAASVELSVAHPPGLPLHSLFYKFISLVLPIGEVAFRSNAASALLAALATCFAFRVSVLLGMKVSTSAVSATLVIPTPIFLLHATAVEVYAGTAVLTFLCIEFIIRGLRHDDGRLLVVVGFLLGLGIAGHHAELRLVALVLVLFIWRSTRDYRRFIALSIAGAIAAGIIVMLPIRAISEPMRNWADPSNLNNLWELFWGARIRNAYGDVMGTVDLDVIIEFLGQLSAGVPVLITLGLFGLIPLYRRKYGAMIVMILALDVLYSVIVNPMGVRDQQNGFISLLCLSVSAACVLEIIHTQLQDRPLLRPTALFACILLNWSAFNGFPMGDDRGLSELTDISSDKLLPNSLLFVASDHMASGWAYKQVVERARPDVAVIVRQHIGYISSNGPTRRRLPKSMSGWSEGGKLSDLTHLNDDWPVAWEWATGLDSQWRPPGLTPDFPLFQKHARSRSEYGDELRVWQQEEAGMQPYRQRAVAQLATDYGTYLLDQGRFNEATAYLRWATELGPEEQSRWTNLGVALNALNRVRGAVSATEYALELNRGDSLARRNLARYHIRLREWSEAIVHLKILIETSPTATDLGLLGVCYANMGDLRRARVLFTKALERDPNQPEAKAGMKILEASQSP